MYYLYILLCNNRLLYTGITKNLPTRLSNHRSGKGSRFVYSKLPFKLIYVTSCSNKFDAAKRERQIKRWRREKKIQILKLKID